MGWTKLLKESLPTKVLMLSTHSDDAYVKEATESGAVEFLLKQTSAHDVCLAIREVQKGNTFFSPSVAKRLHERDRKSPDRGGSPKSRDGHLTSRETEVLQLIGEGKANKETTAELGISIKTVEKHRENLMEKFDIHDTAGLTCYAISAGIIESSVQLTITYPSRSLGFLSCAQPTPGQLALRRLRGKTFRMGTSPRVNTL